MLKPFTFAIFAALVSVTLPARCAQPQSPASTCEPCDALAATLGENTLDPSTRMWIFKGRCEPVESTPAATPSESLGGNHSQAAATSERCHVDPSMLFPELCPACRDFLEFYAMAGMPMTPQGIATDAMWILKGRFSCPHIMTALKP